MWIDDQILERSAENYALRIWRPENSVVILGSGNKADLECNLNHCQKDQIEILKRYGGGGTVLLHSGCAIISFGCWVRYHYKNDLYFDKMNSAVINCLQSRWPSLRHLTQEGISDIAYNHQKICGTSLFRSRNYLLYQASILVEDRIDFINRYLSHPTKEPEYRQGKSHSEFLTNLQKIDNSITISDTVIQLESSLISEIFSALDGELIESQSMQVPHILNKIHRHKNNTQTNKTT
ncbi:MAG: hypothetical protein R3B45_09115 [Bdellovibrionota bacterium]